MQKQNNRRLVFASLILTQIAVIANAQALIGAKSTSPTLESWSQFFPSLARCDANTSAISDDRRGNISQIIRYRPSRPIINGSIDLVIESEPSFHSDDCGYVSVEMMIPYSPPVRVISKEEQKAEKERAKQEMKARKQSEKITKLYEGMFPAAPPPRAFKIKGFEAYQYFSPPSDCLGCEDPFLTISVKFAKDKKLTAQLIGNLESIIQIVEKIDFEKLGAAMDAYARAQEYLPSK